VGANILLPQRVKAACVRTVQNLELRLKYGTSDFPRSIGIEINAHCNRRCSYCINAVSPQPVQNMAEPVFEKVLDRLREVRWSGIVRLHFINEPLLRKDLESLVSRICLAAPGSMLHLYTNGDLLTLDRCATLIEAGVTNFVVTRHPPFSQKWDDQLRKVRERFSAYVTWNGELTVFHDWAGALNITANHGMRTCEMPREVFQILVDGRVNLCCVDTSRQNVYGSIVDHGIKEIWNSPAFLAVRQGLRQGKPDLLCCVRCLAGGDPQKDTAGEASTKA